MAYGGNYSNPYMSVQPNMNYGNNGYNGYQNGYSGGYQQAAPVNYNQPVQNYGMQPYQSAPQQIQTSMAFVNGSIEGRAYPVAPGNRVYLFDTDGRTFYVKGVDFNGMPLPFKTYDYTETVEQQLPMQSQSYDGQPTVDMSNYIRRDEVENMIAQEVERRMAAMSVNTVPATTAAKTGTKKGADVGA